MNPVHSEDPVGWHTVTDYAPGTLMAYLYVCPGGPEEKNKHLPSFQPDEIDLPAYRHWRQAPRATMAMKVEPPSKPYSSANVNNGQAWIHAMPNLWMSDPDQALPQHVELAWEGSVQISRVEVSFDTNLSRITQSAEPFFRAPEWKSRHGWMANGKGSSGRPTTTSARASPRSRPSKHSG